MGQGLVLLGLGYHLGDTSPASEKGPPWAAVWEAAREQSTAGTVPVPPAQHRPSRRPSPVLPLPAAEAGQNLPR